MTQVLIEFENGEKILYIESDIHDLKTGNDIYIIYHRIFQEMIKHYNHIDFDFE